MVYRFLLVFLLCLSGSSAFAGIHDDRPDVIACEFPAVADRSAGVLVLYVEALMDGDTIHYKSFGNPPITVKVNKEGKVEAGRIKSCDGKTVDELRDAGRAFDFR